MFDFNFNFTPANHKAMSACHDMLLLRCGFECTGTGMIERGNILTPATSWIKSLEQNPFQIKAHSYQNNILLSVQDLSGVMDYLCPFDLLLAKTISKFELIPVNGDRRLNLVNAINSVLLDFNRVIAEG